MSKSRKSNIGGQIKSLMMVFGGKAAVLLPENRAMEFASAPAALDWCARHGRAFICLQPEQNLALS